jgi:hypothetical protein
MNEVVEVNGSAALDWGQVRGIYRETAASDSRQAIASITPAVRISLGLPVIGDKAKVSVKRVSVS